jgi:hypothetical protein
MVRIEDPSTNHEEARCSRAPKPVAVTSYLADGGQWFCDPDSQSIHTDCDTVDSLLVV